MPAVERQNPNVKKTLNRLNVEPNIQRVDLCKPCYDWFLNGQFTVPHADYGKEPVRYCEVCGEQLGGADN